MTEETKKIYLENYTNQNDCKNLQDYVDYIEKKTKTGDKIKIAYLRWAVAERIFNLQGGTIELLNAEEFTKYYIDISTEKTINQFLILKATWQGLELIEFYPYIDGFNTIVNPSAIEKNKILQRAKTRLIARISGIGLKLYEGLTLEETEEVEIKEKVEGLEIPNSLLLDDKHAVITKEGLLSFQKLTSEEEAEYKKTKETKETETKLNSFRDDDDDDWNW